jgi:Lysylphosphatidylglycerol synthase TM region
MTPTRRGLGGPAVKALVAAALLAALCLAVDLDEAAAALRHARPLPLATALAASVLGVLVSAEKWRGLLREAGVRLSLAACARLYWVGMFASNLLTTGVGGDAARLLLTPAPGRRAAVAGSILVERLTGFLVMLALCTLGLALRPAHFDVPGLRGRSSPPCSPSASGWSRPCSRRAGWRRSWRGSPGACPRPCAARPGPRPGSPRRWRA